MFIFITYPFEHQKLVVHNREEEIQVTTQKE